MEPEHLLLIEEDAQDYLKIRRLLDEQNKFSVDWAPTYESASRLLKKNSYKVYLISYSAKKVQAQQFLERLYPVIRVPTILLTKNNEKISHIFLDKMEFLDKDQLNWPLLERTIRYLANILALRQIEKQFRLVFDNTFEFISLLDHKGLVLEINQAALTFWGIERAAILGHPFWETPWAKLSSTSQAQFKTAIAKSARGELIHQEMEVRNRQGRLIHLDCFLKPMSDVQDYVTWILVEGHSLEERKQVEQQLQYSHLYDQLTGLPNRHSFIEHLERALAEVQRQPNYHIAVLFIDLDRFKLINASLGHDMGDWLLMEIARRLRNYLQKDLILARSGGDEFLILLDNLQDLTEATRLAASINEELARPFLLDGYEMITSASIGIAYSTPHEGRLDLLRDADAAMYRAKAMGKSCYAVFNNGMYTQAMSRLKIEMELYQALEKQNFVLFYQPQIELSSEELIGAEALIRLSHPQKGLMFPVDLFPALEDTGIIVTLGEWILRTACQQLRTWLEADLPLSHISVNVSAHQFRSKHFQDAVTEALASAGLSPENLELELTETLLLEDTHSAIKTLARFKDLGIRVTIDDFGTGYASLNYLKRFPADSLKIDKSFIHGITTVPTDAAITVATIEMAHALGLTVVAEGVETLEQRDFLRDHGCDGAQGYLYAAPVEGQAFLKWAKQYHRMMQSKSK